MNIFEADEQRVREKIKQRLQDVDGLEYLYILNEIDRVLRDFERADVVMRHSDWQKIEKLNKLIDKLRQLTT